MAGPAGLTADLRDRVGTLGPYLPAIAVVVIQLAVFGVPTGVWVQGLVLGLLNALVALGLTLIWRSNRVLNFAQADMGLLPAALGVAFCIFWGWSWFAGFGIGLAAAVVVGVGVEFIVIRRFRNSPRLTLTVATIGVAQFCLLLALVLPRMWGEQVLSSPDRSGYRFPWKFSFEIGTTVFHSDDIVAVVVSLACLIGVSRFLTVSGTGIAIRAAAERSARAELLGVPVLRMELITWVVASVLSFLGVFLQGAILGFPLSLSVGIVTLVTALAALALGGFDRIGPITAAAVAVGVLLQGVRWHNPTHPAFTYAILGLVIAIPMLLRRRGRTRAERDPISSWLASLEPRALPGRFRARGRRLAVAAGAVVVVLAVVLPIGMGESRQFDLATLVAFGIIALSIAVLTGWAGQITLGQMGFAALGAAIGSVATVTWQLDVTLGLLVVIVAGAVAGVIVGLPSLRHSGLLPAAVTLAFALAASGYLFDPNQFGWIPAGAVEPQKALGVWSIAEPLGAYQFSLVILVLCVTGLLGIRSSSVGRAIRATRDNELAARSYAISPAAAKLGAYGISGALAAIGGFLLVHTAHHFDAATYGPAESLTIFTASVVGGVGSLLGVLLGAGYLNGARWMLTGYWQLLPTAVGVLVVLWLFPGGFSSVLYRLRDRLLTRDEPGTAADEPVGIDAPAPPAAGEDSTDGLLQARGVQVAYAGVPVLFDVDLTVRQGEILALMGTNGAGKSTLLSALCGVTPMRSGTVRFADEDLTGRPAPMIARRGIGQMPGGQAVFETLTVADNLRVAGWLIRADRAELDRRIAAAYQRSPVLAERRNEPAANLSGGQQQMLALEMVLLNRPSLVMIDELTLGLSPLVIDDIIARVKALNDTGTTVVVVDQSVEVALRLADRAYFLERGTIRFEGPTAELAERSDLLRSVYLAHDAGAPERNGASLGTRAETSALRLHQVTVAFDGPTVLDEVDLTVADGQICAVIGPNGAGKTTLFDVISGFTRTRSGSVELLGAPVDGRSATARATRGLGRSFQDSRLFPSLTVTETIGVATNRWVTGPDPASAALWLPVRQLAETATAARVDELIERMGLGHVAENRIGELSTGQRRLVDIACAVAHGSRLLLLDEPSSGVARAEAEALVAMIRSLRETLDATIIVVEHDMAVASELADHMVALDLGRVIASGSPAQVLDDPDVIEAYLGRQADVPSGKGVQAE